MTSSNHLPILRSKEECKTELQGYPWETVWCVGSVKNSGESYLLF